MSLLKTLLSLEDGEYRRLTWLSAEYPNLESLLKEAEKDPELKGITFDRTGKKYVGLWYDGLLVGFATPRREGSSYWRTGAIYVTPNYRRKGVATTFVKQFFSTRKGVSYIRDGNIASEKTYLASGFQKTEKTIMEDGVPYRQYRKD